MQTSEDNPRTNAPLESDFKEDPEIAADGHAHVPTHFDPRTGRTMGIVAGVLAVCLLVGFFFVQHHRSAAAFALDTETADVAATPVTVDVVRVHDAPTNEQLTLPGNTAAWYQSTIYARVSGYVDKWLVDIGDKVKKGQVLATIDTPDLDAQLAAAQAKFMASQAQERVEEADASFAQSTYERWKDSPKGVVSEQEREEKKAEYNSGVAKLAAAKAQVTLSKADVDNLQALTAFKQVTAPYDGVITGRRIDIGDLVTAGSTAATTSLFTIAQSDTMRIFVDVPQAASDQTTVGMPAVITASQLQFEGKVTRTANSIDPVSRTLRVEADVPNPDLTLVPGMYVEVHFELVNRAVLQVPASALLFRSEGTQVAVVGDDNKISFRKVTIIRDQGDAVEVSGIKVGDRVALNLSSQVSDGDKVTPNEVKRQSPATQGATTARTAANG